MGWRSPIERPVSCIAAIHRSSALGLARSKRLFEALIDGQPGEVPVSSELAAHELAAELSALSVVCEVRRPSAS